MPTDKAERRQLTILFADLVDSVALSTRLDPEDLRDLMAVYHQACMQTVERHNGYVARYLGDGVLIYFGYPAANEDDAERAVRAALELVAAVGKLNDGVETFPDLDLRIRVGIATGLVVVGDEMSQNMLEKGDIAGEAVNLAARLQAMAEPNSVVASATTRQLAGERFEYRDLGAQDVKGFAAPIPMYQALEEREISRFAARSAAATPFVGRNKEIDAIVALWTQAMARSGQVAIIAGEAGIGKSRIATEASARIRRLCADDATALLFQCQPHHTNAPLYPVIKQLEHVANLDRSASRQENLRKLEMLFPYFTGRDERKLSAIADLLGLEWEELKPPATVGAVVKRHLTLEALGDWVAAAARKAPLIITFEDVQWIDPTSRIFLDRLIGWARTAPVLIMITLRADNTNIEKSLENAGLAVESERPSHVTVHELGELDMVEATQLAAAAAEGMTIPEGQLNAILAKSDRIPLYLEELVKTVVKWTEIPPGHAWGDQTDGVPNTLRDALMARLDSLGHAKEVAQHAAVIGQEFSADLLARIEKKTFGDLRPDLCRLVDAKVLVSNAASRNVYRFKHALIRDIAYRVLLRKSRRQIHLAVAKELDDTTTVAADVTDDLIAQHYSQGAAYSQAIQSWQRGAKAAIARSAHHEALGMLDAARADLRKLRGPEWRTVELDLVLSQAIALRSLFGYSAAEVEERLLEARELCSVCGDSSNRFNVEWGLFQCTIVKGDIDGAARLAAGLFDHAKRHPDLPLIDAYIANGMATLNAGRFEAARRHLETGVGLSHPETDRPHFFTHGQNPGLFCLSYLARTLCFLGYLDLARATMSRCLAIASERAADRGHLYGYVNALMHAVRVYDLCGDLEAEQRVAQETYQISRDNHYAYYEALSRCHLAWVAGRQGFVAKGIEEMVDGLSALEQTGTTLALPGLYVLLAQLYLRAQQWDEASKVLQMAVGAHAVWAADVERVRGDILSLRADPDLDGAEDAYRSSLTIARRQCAGLLEFKAGVRLARLLESRDRRTEAREVLSTCRRNMHGNFGDSNMQEASKTINDPVDIVF